MRSIQSQSISKPSRVSAFVGVFSLGGFVAFFKLGTASYHVDEILYRAASRNVFRADGYHMYEHPPLGKQAIHLSMTLFGDSRFASRLPGAIAGYLVGFIIFALLRRFSGFWTALLGAAIWFFLPHSAGASEYIVARSERHVFIDQYATLFFVLALYFAWRWRDAKPKTWLIPAGFAGGLAAASKLTALAGAPAVLIGLSQRAKHASTRVSPLWTAGFAALSGFLVTYLPYGGRIPEAVKAPFEYLRGYSEQGNLQLVAGELTRHPPWWAHLWFQWQSIGTIAAAGICISLVGFIAARRRSESLFIATAPGVPLVAFALMRVKIDHHHVGYAAPLAMATALGIAELARRWRLAGLVVLLLVPASLGVVGEVSTIKTTDWDAASDFLEHSSPDQDVISVVGNAILADGNLFGYRLRYGLSTSNPDCLITTTSATTGPVTMDHDFDLIVIDDRADKLCPMTDVADYLSKNRAQYTSKTFGHVSIYKVRDAP